MGIEIITLLFLIVILIGAVSGYPIGLVLGGWSLLIGYIHFGDNVFNYYVYRCFC